MDNSQLQINIPYCQQQTNGVDCGIYPVQMHFKFQVELACQTLKLIKIDESALFFSIYSRIVLKCLPKKQRNTVTLSSLEAISTAEIFCISKMWWLWYHIKNPDLSMADCENIPGDVINKFKGSMQWHCSDCKQVHIAWLFFFLSGFSSTKIRDSYDSTGNEISLARPYHFHLLHR